MRLKQTAGALAAGISSAWIVILILDDSLRALLQDIPHTYLILMKGASLRRLLQPASLSFYAIFILLGVVGSLFGAAILVSIAQTGRMKLKAGNIRGETEKDVDVGIAALGGVFGAGFFFFLFLLAELAMDK